MHEAMNWLLKHPIMKVSNNYTLGDKKMLV